jgi:hypothetical protein
VARVATVIVVIRGHMEPPPASLAKKDVSRFAGLILRVVGIELRVPPTPCLDKHMVWSNPFFHRIKDCRIAWDALES